MGGINETSKVSEILENENQPSCPVASTKVCSSAPDCHVTVHSAFEISSCALVTAPKLRVSNSNAAPGILLGAGSLS